MDDTRCRQFFLEPTATSHRQYEALRAFFVEGRQLPEIAQQFGYQESSLRSMVCRFRSHVQTPVRYPFLCNRGLGGLRAPPVPPRQPARRRQRSPTGVPWTCLRDAACARA
jgi:hypothetical protein